MIGLQDYDPTWKKLRQLPLGEYFWLRRVHNVGALKKLQASGKRIFQVVGVPRSGTTLLAIKLNNHPAVACLNEPYLNCQHSGRVSVQPFLQPVLGGEKLPLLPHQALGRLCDNPETGFVGFKETFRNAELQSHYANDAFLRELTATGAVQKTIATIRDPRAVWYSHRRKQLRYNPEARVVLTTRFTDNWNAYVEWVSGSPAFCMRYEDLVTGPEDTLRKVADYLGLTFDPVLLDGRADEKPAKWHYRRKIDTSSVTLFNENLSEEDASFLAEHCAKWMQYYGYDKDPEVPSSSGSAGV